VEAKRVVLEGRAVALAHQEADEARVRVVELGLAAREADACGVHDREIARHGVVQADEAVVENVDRVLVHGTLCDGHGARV